MIKTLLTGVVLCFCLAKANAQKVSLLTTDQLNERLRQGKDTVFMVNLWATWCRPCVKELPNFEKLQKTFSAQPLKVLLLSLDFKSKLESDLKPFIKRMKIGSEVFLLNETDQQSFINKIDTSWSGNIPATLIVNTARKRRQFVSNELTYKELLNMYKLNK